MDTWFLVKDIVGKQNYSHKIKTDLIIHSKYNFEIIISRK